MINCDGVQSIGRLYCKIELAHFCEPNGPTSVEGENDRGSCYPLVIASCVHRYWVVGIIENSGPAPRVEASRRYASDAPGDQPGITKLKRETP